MKRFSREMARMIALVLVTGVAAAVLVRYSPGMFVDERELNQQLGGRVSKLVDWSARAARVTAETVVDEIGQHQQGIGRSRG